MLLKLAWKNLWRNKVRSRTIILSIILGLTGGIFSVALFNGLTEQKLSNAIETQTAHIQIHKKKFLDDYDIRKSIHNHNLVSKTIKENPLVKGYVTRVVTTGMMTSASGGSGVQAFGVDPKEEKKVSKIYDRIIDGKYFEGIKKNPIVIGEKLAEKLDAKVRSKIVLNTQDKEGNIVGSAFRVVGIFKTNSSNFDEANVFVKKKDLWKLLKANGSIHEIAVVVEDEDLSDKVKEGFVSKLDSKLEIETWKEIQPELAVMSDFSERVYLFFIAIILIALGFGILNTMLMAIFERTKEIGVLMAVGMSKSKVFGMIILESTFLALIGATLGMILSITLISWTGSSGINLSAFQQGFESFGVGTIIYPQLSIGFYFQLMLMVILSAILFSIYPAFKALKLNPVEAIRSK